jgi:ABC-type Fe3+ transport system substrate-binding protein
MTKSRLPMIALAVVAIVVSACGGGASPTPAPTATPGATTAGPSPTEDAFAKTWADLITAAKADGELVVVTGPEGVQDDGDWLNAFGDEFGIKITVVGGATADITARIEAERAQGVFSVDIAGLGGTGTKNMLADGFLDQLDPLLINPEVTDRSVGFAVDHPVYTAEDAVGICQYIAVQAEPNLITWWYNTEKVTQAEYDGVKSFNDLLDPKFKGRIVIGDIGNSEANRDAVSLWNVAGKAWYDKLLGDMDVTIVAYGDERTYADGLIQGEWAIGLFPPGAGSLQDAADAGLPVKIWENTMTEGAPRSGIQRVCVFKDRPHPAATQLFANWSLMKSGQTALNAKTNRNDRASIRDDVPQGKISDAVWTLARDNTKPFIDDVNPEWLAQTKAFLDYAKAKYAELGIVPGG